MDYKVDEECRTAKGRQADGRTHKGDTQRRSARQQHNVDLNGAAAAGQEAAVA